MTTKQSQNVYRRKVEEIERLHKENAKLSERLEAGQKAKYALHNELANLRIQNAGQGLTLACIEEILHDDKRSDRNKVLGIKWLLKK